MQRHRFIQWSESENAKKLWQTIIENHEGTEDVANERYHVLIDKLNSFKQLDDENAESMYSRLNTLVNEVNSFVRCEAN